MAKIPLEKPFIQFPDIKFKFGADEVPDHETIVKSRDMFDVWSHWDVWIKSDNTSKAWFNIVQNMPEFFSKNNWEYSFSGQMEPNENGYKKITPEECLSKKIPYLSYFKIVDGLNRSGIHLNRPRIDEIEASIPVQFIEKDKFTEETFIKILRYLGDISGCLVYVTDVDYKDNPIFLYDPSDRCFYSNF